MTRGRRARFGYGTVCVLLGGTAVVLAVRLLPAARTGDVDPLGAVLGLLALLAAVWSGKQAARSLRLQQTNLVDAEERLAATLLQHEIPRRDLLLGGGQNINLAVRRVRGSSSSVDGAAAHGRLNSITGYYQDLTPPRMVITGEPGSGKSNLATRLTLGLLATAGPGTPTPLRCSLTSWNPERPLMDWLVDQLVRQGNLRADTARTLLEARRVLPVLDGLDEMDLDATPVGRRRAARALAQLNTYQDATGPGPLVLTCRSRQYEELEANDLYLAASARIEVQSPSWRERTAYLTARGANQDRWRPILDRLRFAPRGRLANALATPWRLNLAATVYEERDPTTSAYRRDPRELLDSRLGDAEAIRDHLLGLYIPATMAGMTSEVGSSRRRYSPWRVHVWLATLARYLESNRSRPGLPTTDLVLHELWPLVGERRSRLVHTALMSAASGLLAVVCILGALGAAGSPWSLALTCALSLLSWTGVTWGAWQIRRLNLTHTALGTLRSRTVRRAVFPRVLVATVVVTGCLALTHDVGTGRWRAAWLGSIALLTLYTYLFMGIQLPFPPRQAVDPRDPLRGGTRAVLLGGPAFLVVALLYNTAVPRYLALLLCTRRYGAHWLPWRLGRFLHWGREVGLLRVSGVAYQFRHRELQEWLARQPRPTRRG